MTASADGQTTFVNESKTALSQANSGDSEALSQSAEETLLNQLVYYQYAYDGGSRSSSEESPLASTTRAVGTDASGKANSELASQVLDFQNSILSDQSSDVSFVADEDESVHQRSAKTLTFIRSEYAAGRGVDVQKTYSTTASGGVLVSGSPVTVSIRLKNTTATSLKDIVYLEKPDSLIAVSDGANYTISQNGKTQEKPLQDLSGGDFTYGFDHLSLAPNEEIAISYSGSANAVDIGSFQAGLESGDTYGSISLTPNKTCGASSILWQAIASREYKRGSKTASTSSGSSVNPASIQSDTETLTQLYTDLADAVKNGNKTLATTIQQKIDALKEKLKQNSDDAESGVIG